MSDDNIYADCDFSGLPRVFCSHCKEQVAAVEAAKAAQEEPPEFEVIAVFDAQFNGVCTIDREHKVKRGTRVGRVQRADNPMIPVQGVACASCVKLLNRA